MLSRLTHTAAAVAAAALLVTVSGCALEDDSPSTSGGTGSGSEELTTVRVGYLHTPAVDTHLWLGIAEGIWEEHGLQIEPVAFDTGIAESQALTGGSLDVAIMGAVMANFPAQGQGKVFLLNDVERDTAQLWVHGDAGIDSVEDLAGKQVATTQGTTAQIFLNDSLQSAGLGFDDVTLVNSAMPAAVNAFITGAVPAVALWAPFDLQVQELAPGAKKIDSAGSYFPETAITGGWVANNEVYADDPEMLRKITAAWLDINERLTDDTEASLAAAYEAGYADDISQEDYTYIFGLSDTYTNSEWNEHFESGQADEWVGGLTRSFVDIGGLPEYVEPSTFFDQKIYQDVYADSTS